MPRQRAEPSLPEIDVAALRKRLGLFQDKFGRAFNISPAAIRDWEQGRRKPDAIALTLLTVINREPEAVQRALHAAQFSGARSFPQSG